MKPKSRWFAPLLQAGPIAELAMIDRPRILIVEDDLGLRSAICDLIRKISPFIQVDWITQADEVQRELSEHRFELSHVYDLVISDIRLAGKKTGLDLWSTCHELSPDVPFLLISGMGLDSFTGQVAASSEQPQFLAKPFTTDEIRSRIESMLKRELPEKPLLKTG